MQFDKAAKNYTKHNQMQINASKILHELLPETANNVLEVGTGPGACLLELKNKYQNIIGCDLSLEMAKIANNHAPVIVANADNLPFRNNSFDLIYSNLVLQWLPDLYHTFKQFHRASKVNGELIASTLGPQTLIEARQALSSIDRANNINQFMDLKDIGNLLLKSGWHEIFTSTELIKIEYNSANEVFLNLKNIGANTALSPNACKKLITPRIWNRCLENYPLDGKKYIATFEIITMRAKKQLPRNEISPEMISRK